MSFNGKYEEFDGKYVSEMRVCQFCSRRDVPGIGISRCGITFAGICLNCLRDASDLVPRGEGDETSAALKNGAAENAPGGTND